MEPNTNPVVQCAKEFTANSSKLCLASVSNTVPFKVAACSHIWIIHNLSYCLENMDSLSSACFETNDKDKWSMRLLINKESFSLGLNLLYHGKLTAHTNYKLSILNSKSEEINIKTKKFMFYDRSYIDGFSPFIKLDFLLDVSEGLLPDDKLTIFCEVNVMKKSITAETVNFDIPKCRLLDNFKLLHENKKFSDVILSVAGKDFQAHKAILAARSPVFQAMFENEMKESMDSRVDITDIDETVIKEMLRFIYTGEVLNLESIAHDLLVAADKYGLERLKLMCEKVLCVQLSVENVVEMLILADLHIVSHLKAQAINFVSIHATKVMSTPEWKTAIAQYPLIITECVCSALRGLTEATI